MIGVAVQFDDSTLPNVAGEPEINVAVSFPRIVFAPAIYSGCQIVEFTAVAGQTDYTVADVADLVRIVGKEVKFVSMDGSILTPLFRSWDDTTFTITDVTVEGGETVVIIAI